MSGGGGGGVEVCAQVEEVLAHGEAEPVDI